MIERAVIFAAGRGTRLGELTADVAKPLLDVGGRPIIVRILDGLVRAGIHGVVIITGYRAAELESELGNGAGSGLAITYVRQEQLDGTARALALARQLLGHERFFFTWGDILVEPANYRRVLRAGHLAENALAVNEVDDPAPGAAVYLGEDSRITRIVEKPAPGASTTRWNNAGFGVLGPAIWPAIDALAPSAAGEYELPRAVAAMVEAGEEVTAVPVEGSWFDIGTPASLAAARAAFGR